MAIIKGRRCSCPLMSSRCSSRSSATLSRILSIRSRPMRLSTSRAALCVGYRQMKSRRRKMMCRAHPQTMSTSQRRAGPWARRTMRQLFDSLRMWCCRTLFCFERARQISPSYTQSWKPYFRQPLIAMMPRSMHWRPYVSLTRPMGASETPRASLTGLCRLSRGFAPRLWSRAILAWPCGVYYYLCGQHD
jgi:hypothetical protein